MTAIGMVKDQDIFSRFVVVTGLQAKRFFATFKYPDHFGHLVCPIHAGGHEDNSRLGDDS